VSQLIYAEQSPAFAGMMADIMRGMVKDTMLNGEASAEIAFGKFVVENTAMNTSGTPALAKLPAAGGDDFAGGGVVLHSHDYDKRLDLGDTGIKPKRQMTVMKKGRVWVYGEVAMAKADDVYVRHTVNGLLVPGDFRNDADTAKAVKLYGARVITPTTAAGLFQLELDMAAHRAH
jgi:hypothetical protein